MLTLFKVMAAIGTALFITQFILVLLGGDSDADVGEDIGHQHGMANPDFAFQWLSLQSVATFTLFTGLLGLASYYTWPEYPNLGGVFACIGGIFITWLYALFMLQFRKLQSSGNANLNHAIGKNAQVYLTINGSEGGKVIIVVQGRQHILNASTQATLSFPTGAEVTVLKLLPGPCLLVGPVSHQQDSRDE